MAQIENNGIVQDTKSNGSRTYQKKGSERKYPSVTTVISKVAMDWQALKKWKEFVGEDQAAEISRAASSLGTKVHAVNELYFSKELVIPEKYSEDAEVMNRHQLFIPFLEYVEPMFIEEAIVWETLCQDRYIGFGGTPDLVGTFKKPEILGLKTEGPIIFLADYKNWSKSKTADRLTDKYLQLAAYTAAVNSKLPEAKKIKHAFILGTTKKKLHIFYISLRELNWYWVWFFEGLKKYYELDTPFNRAKFQEFSAGYILEGLDEDNKKVWGQREENYLGEKLIILPEDSL
jgi:hypothetical protein